MKKRQPRSEKALPKIERFLEELDGEDLLFPTGFKDCIIGTKDMVIKKLMKDMTRMEAEEFYEFNILGSHMGAGTPAFATLIK